MVLEFRYEILYRGSRAAHVIAIDQLTGQQFEKHALEVLAREFGADGLARFLA